MGIEEVKVQTNTQFEEKITKGGKFWDATNKMCRSKIWLNMHKTSKGDYYNLREME